MDDRQADAPRTGADHFRSRSAACAAQARRVRMRARLDLLLALLATAGAASLGADAHEALLGGSAVLSLGILVYVIRRDRDLVALSASARWREAAVEGRGLQLQDWRSGVPLAAWSARRDEQVREAA